MLKQTLLAPIPILQRKEAELRKQKADLEVDLEVLAEEKKAAAVEAESQALQSADRPCKSVSSQYTEAFVEQQNVIDNTGYFRKSETVKLDKPDVCENDPLTSELHTRTQTRVSNTHNVNTAKPYWRFHQVLIEERFASY